ncbi:immunoglobulin domain-containing protein oig-4 isoform X3 [Lepeophtheirus salmonis]|nr:immunoglobulin domain-containing protein oig-4-like isoform X2 [Lepeophtheirus salmonis]
MYLKISNMFFPILQPPTFIYIFVMFLLLVRENEVNSKTSRVRTNYKLRVGEQRVGRYTPYSQVRLPSTGEYPYGEAENYYKHAKGARITKASHFDYEYVLGHKIVFICVAKGKPRPKIIWFKDGRELYDHGYLHISEWYKGKRRLKSKMEIDPATQGDAGIYECHANNKWSVDMRSFRTDYNIFFDKK